MTTPNPGSDEAIAQGCKCPVLDNCHGKGAYCGKEGEFFISSLCRLHNKEPEVIEKGKNKFLTYPFRPFTDGAGPSKKGEKSSGN